MAPRNNDSELDYYPKGKFQHVNDESNTQEKVRSKSDKMDGNGQPGEDIDTYFMAEIPVPETDSYAFSFRKLWAYTGPGLLISIAFLDPGNIQADMSTGSNAKYKLLWVLLWSTILGLLVQRLAARLGIVTGLHLAELCHRRYPRVPRILLWIMTELAIIGSDMQEVIGTAIAIYLLSTKVIPLWAGVLITICDTFTFLFLDKYGLRKLESFFALLIMVMAVTFGYEYFKVNPDEAAVAYGTAVPYCSDCGSSELMQAIGLIGAIIAPYNLYLHSALVKSRKIKREVKEEVSDANRYFFIETAIAIFVSFFINIFVISVFAEGLYQKTNADVHKTCEDSSISYLNTFPNDTEPVDANLFNAGVFLGCTFGIEALYIWGIGLFAAGQSSTMTGTYSGQFVMEGFLNLHWERWKRVLLTRTIAIIPTLLITYYQDLESLSTMNDLLNAMMSLQLPFALLPAITFTSSTKVMGCFANGISNKILMTLLAITLITINLYFVINFFNDHLSDNIIALVLLIIFFIYYSLFLLYLAGCLAVVYGLKVLTRIPYIGHLMAEKDSIEYSYLDNASQTSSGSSDSSTSISRI